MAGRLQLQVASKCLVLHAQVVAPSRLIEHRYHACFTHCQQILYNHKVAHGLRSGAAQPYAEGWWVPREAGRSSPAPAHQALRMGSFARASHLIRHSPSSSRRRRLAWGVAPHRGSHADPNRRLDELPRQRRDGRARHSLLEDRPGRTSTGHRCSAAMLHQRGGSCRTETTGTCQRNDHAQSRLRADAPSPGCMLCSDCHS